MKALLAKVMPGKASLGARALSAGAWSLTSAGATFVLRLASNLIMTRLLVPEAFGMMAFAMTFVSGVVLLSDIGVHQSIVREKNLTPRFLRVAWTVKIVRSLVIALGVLLCALIFGFVGPAFGQPDSVMVRPEVPYLIAMAALSPIMTGLVSTNFDLAKRQLKYRSLFILEVGGEHLFRIVCQIAFALISPTVWALLAGTIAGGLGKVIASHMFLSGPKMRLRWDRDITTQLWRFGRWLMGSSGMTFVVNNADKLIFGFSISALSLGLYSIAFIWISAAQTVIKNFTNSVGYPVVSEIMRTREADAKRLIRKYTSMIDLLCFGGFAALFLFGQLILDLLYTEEYAGAGRMIQLLAPLCLSMRYQQLVNVIMARGTTSVVFVNSTLVAIAMVTFIFAGLRLGGLEAAITGTILARFVSVPFLLIHTSRFFGARQTMYDAAWAILSVAATLGIYLHQ